MDSKTIIKQWLSHISQPRTQIGGKSICPFAVTPIIVEVDCLGVEHFDKLNHDITIYIEKNKTSTFIEIDALCKILNKKYQEYIFLPDHPDRPNYIQGVPTGNGHRPVIIAQRKQELASARNKLEKTNYYSYWNEDYLKEIKSYGSK